MVDEFGSGRHTRRSLEAVPAEAGSRSSAMATVNLEETRRRCYSTRSNDVTPSGTTRGRLRGILGTKLGKKKKREKKTVRIYQEHHQTCHTINNLRSSEWLRRRRTI